MREWKPVDGMPHSSARSAERKTVTPQVAKEVGRALIAEQTAQKGNALEACSRGFCGISREATALPANAICCQMLAAIA